VFVLVLRPFALALSFLTRAPIALADVEEADFGRSVAYFPAVGVLLGAALGATERLARGHFSHELVALALVTLLVVVTGGLHLDGLADVFDGLGGGRGDRERILAIMRDSRIGSLGATALLLALLGKVFALIELQRTGAAFALFVFPVAARWVACALLVFFPYARPEGLGKAFNGHARPRHFVLATLSTATVLAIAGPRALAPTAVAFAVGLTLALWLHRRLGGLTGDVYGAAIELSELGFLLAVSAAR
jgi:adenosylcobinamide-GDP ribazoletransferase